MGDNVSDIEEQILAMLVSAGGRELYGLEMVKEADGALKRGTIYVTLQRMAKKGLLESREEDEAAEHIGLRRRLYKVTGLGARALKAAEMHRLIMAGALVPEGAS